jgi:phosphoribosyl 1,2-cyclic phosphodiesterase
MKIQVLGNGGGINEGLPYNTFVVDGILLCETPPDIMLSLHKNAIEISSIKTVYISHLHGDHTFGLPFLLLSAFFAHWRDGQVSSYTIVGPEGLEKAAEDLVVSAFTAGHPCLGWMKQFCAFVEIDVLSEPVLLKGYHTSVFRLDHFSPTFGFSLANREGNVEFAYVADTKWCAAIRRVLEDQPRLVLVDLNGQDNDPIPVHLSRRDLREKALPITGENTTYYGTHLKKEFQSAIPCIKCAKPGMVIEV